MSIAFISDIHGNHDALKEVFKEEEFEYKAFNLNGQIAVIQIKQFQIYF